MNRRLLYLHRHICILSQGEEERFLGNCDRNLKKYVRLRIKFVIVFCCTLKKYLYNKLTDHLFKIKLSVK